MEKEKKFKFKRDKKKLDLYKQNDELDEVLDDDEKRRLKEEYDAKLLKNNSGLTQDEIDEDLELREIERLEKDINEDKEYRDTLGDKFRNYRKSITKMFSGVHTFLYIIVFLFISAIYVTLITDNVIIGIVIAVPISIMLFHYFVYVPYKLKIYMDNLQSLSAYANSMVFYMQSGDNVSKALMKTKKSVNGDVKVDIQRTLNILDKDATNLDTASFKRYNFRNIDVFNQILMIKYLEGGSNVKEMFNNVLKFISFDLVKMDELYKNKKQSRSMVFIMTGMAYAVPLMMALIMEDNYILFLNNPVSVIMLLIYVLLVTLNMCRTQKATCNVMID